MYIIIAGGGKVGYNLTKILADKGHEVTLIEKDKTRYLELSEEMGDAVLWGDACEVALLRDAGCNRANVVVAVTGDDEDNLVVCQMTKAMFIEKARTIARVNDPKNEGVFVDLGVDNTVSTTRVIDALIEEKIESEMLMPLTLLGKGNMEIVQVELSKKSKGVGKKVKDLNLPDETILIAALRGEQVVVLKGEVELTADDMIIALTTKENERKLRKML
jgi:trk system potassium uptake protein TrkA